MREQLTRNISLKDIRFLAVLILGTAKTNVIGNFTHEKGRHWPKSGSYLLPIIESVGKRRTPLELYPIVGLFYDYIRTTDDLFDKEKNLPGWEDTKNSLKTVKDPLFEKLRKSQIIDEAQQKYIFERINSLGESVYSTMEEKSSWTKPPSYEKAYSYRIDTTGLLSDVVADVWCIFAKVPDELRTITKEVIKRLGMVLQFRDDLSDLRQDSEMDGNLVLAVLNEENERYSILSLIKKSKSKINLVKLLRSHAPKSYKRVMDYINKEFEQIRKMSPDTGSKLADLIQFATDINYFIKTE